VNYLIFRYLQESGYIHSAFAFGHESHVYRSSIDGSQIPPGALLSFLQRGLSYAEIEASLHEGTKGGTHSAADGNSINTLMDVHRALVSRPQTGLYPSTMPPVSASFIPQGSSNGHQFGVNSALPQGASGMNQAGNKSSENLPAELRANLKSGENGISSGSVINNAPYPTSAWLNGIANSNSMDHNMNIKQTSTSISQSEVLILRGHNAEVFCCSWNPVSSLLATGAADSTARIWAIPNVLPSGSPTAAAAALAASASPIVLKMEESTTTPAGRSNDCTSIEWNAQGIRLATGTYDGVARVWSEAGELVKTLDRHEGPVLALKWSPSGEALLTGSVDKKAILWYPSSGNDTMIYEHHTGPILDLDWRDDQCFATSSTDKSVAICNVGSTKPAMILTGHQDEVNSVRWNPSGSLLATCSDDFTARIWSPDSPKPRQYLSEHTKEVLAVRWSPLSDSSSLLATASHDSTVKLWNPETGVCVSTLTGHADPVYAIAFSPDGSLLASGSFDRRVLIWSVKDGCVVRDFYGQSGVFEIKWNSAGDRIAACFANSACVVLDPRRSP